MSASGPFEVTPEAAEALVHLLQQHREMQAALILIPSLEFDDPGSLERFERETFWMAYDSPDKFSQWPRSLAALATCRIVGIEAVPRPGLPIVLVKTKSSIGPYFYLVEKGTKRVVHFCKGADTPSCDSGNARLGEFSDVSLFLSACSVTSRYEQPGQSASCTKEPLGALETSRSPRC